MLQFNSLEEKQKILRQGATVDVMSIQDMIDLLTNLQLPKGRTFANTPFGVVDRNGMVKVLYDPHKSLMETLFYKVLFINFNDKDTGIITSKDNLHKRLKELEKENKTLKNKLSKINELVKSFEK